MIRFNQNHTRKLVLIPLLFLFKTACAQPGSVPANQLKYIDIVSPAPGTATLSNFNRPSTGLSSGSAEFNASLFTVPVKSFNLPVALNYRSNGVLVDEIASRVGISWQLIAGGSITRVVQDVVDEAQSFISLPANTQTDTREFLNFLRLATAGANTTVTGYDTQHDLFSYSFGGYSGKFILDSAHNVIQLNQTSLRISKPDFNGSSFVFIITDADGNKFYFGGSQYAEQSSKPSGCGKVADTPVTTAWFIRKIELSTGQFIEFTYAPINYYYDQGINETMNYNFTANNNPGSGFSDCPLFANKSCVNSVYTSTYYLTSISTPDRLINFDYVDRLDCGDKLLSAIEVKSRVDNSIVETYSLKYDIVYTTRFSNSYSIVARDENRYRPFLKSITKQTASDSVNLYRFSYNKPEDLPVRISYAQDHWGYFNGADNTTLIPEPSEPEYQEMFPEADANRSPSFTQGSKGMLTRITYPTGGSDSIMYEANTLYTQVPVQPSPLGVTDTIRGLGEREIQTKVMGDITVSFTQKVLFSIEGINTTGGQPGLYHHGGLKIYQGTQLLDEITAEPGEYEEVEVVLVGNNTYRIEIWAGGNITKIRANFTYRPGTVTYQDTNKAIGGVRVKGLLTYSYDGMLLEARYYRYAAYGNLNASSGQISFDPYYFKYFYQINYAATPGQTLVCGEFKCQYYSMFSSSINSLFTYASNPVMYKYVIESQDENFATGLTEHEYSIQAAGSGQMLVGDYPNGAPLTRNGENMNGKELMTSVYKKEDGLLKLARRIRYVYNQLDTELYPSIVVNKKHGECEVYAGHTTGIPYEAEFRPFEAYRYMTLSSWVVADSVIEEDLTSVPEEILIRKTKYQYDNNISRLPTKVVTYDSKGSQLVTNNYYPNDRALINGLSTQAQTVLDSMVNRNMVSSLICQEQFRGGQFTYKYLASHKIWPVNKILPESVKEYYRTGTEGKAFYYTAYDTTCNLLERRKDDDILEAYLWDYDGTYPIAKVIGASSAQIAATSFEANGKGNWTYSGVGVNSPDTNPPPTGKKCYDLASGSINLSGISSSITYVISYWKRTGAQITINAGTQVGAEETLESTNGWKLVKRKFTGATSITLSGSGYIDELRMYPHGAQMNTYTYIPVIGITSTTDANDVTTYYDYDRLGRLQAVKDHDGNVLKAYSYHYKQ